MTGYNASLRGAEARGEAADWCLRQKQKCVCLVCLVCRKPSNHVRDWSTGHGTIRRLKINQHIIAALCLLEPGDITN
ncbi:hypothetical protein N7519_008414 [Penicillium mononematosum]|uniref:uncharacterized protein n=1 Tax=Penicillium mononematosum TaxID=268346 RepID=UPI002548D592|nr:uncharacterized protein N7519_008414 [Penicillium mononematosum]KAJ6177953.1 hypothetical protein N7519_008414 [Penicillium mononematosum]